MVKELTVEQTSSSQSYNLFELHRQVIQPRTRTDVEVLATYIAAIVGPAFSYTALMGEGGPANSLSLLTLASKQCKLRLLLELLITWEETKDIPRYDGVLGSDTGPWLSWAAEQDSRTD